MTLDLNIVLIIPFLRLFVKLKIANKKIVVRERLIPKRIKREAVSVYRSAGACPPRSFDL